jgi:hypothetical protein
MNSDPGNGLVVDPAKGHTSGSHRASGYTLGFLRYSYLFKILNA